MTEPHYSLAVISPPLATTEEMKAFIPWEVSFSFSGQQNIRQNCDKVVPLPVQQIVQLGGGTAGEGTGREEMKKY